MSVAGPTRPDAQRDGVVAEIHVEPGANLAVGQAILKLKSEGFHSPGLAPARRARNILNPHLFTTCNHCNRPNSFMVSR